MINLKTTVEDYLECLVGLQSDEVEYTIEHSDVSILRSIGRQVFKGTALTDRQYALVKDKLIYYQNQFTSFQISDLENLRIPLREIDRTKYIKIISNSDLYNNSTLREHERYKENWKWISVRFPFSKKLITKLDTISKKHYTHEAGSHIHNFLFTEKNVYQIIDTFIDKNFIIDQELIHIYEILKNMKNNKDDYIPGVYNLKLKNLNNKAINHIISAIGESPNKNNLALFKDRQNVFGLHHFDDNDLEQSLSNYTTLSQKVIKRKSQHVLVNSEKYTFNTLAETILELNRFPLLVLLNEDEALDQLVTVHNAFRGFIANTECSVLMRLDNENNSEFNQYVKTNNLNKPLDKTTKVVYIRSNKIPKPLIKSDWKASSALLLSSFRTDNNTSCLLDMFDLVVHYDDNVSQMLRYQKKIEEV